MKKVTLFAALWIFQQLAMADCSYPTTWTMNIKNGTDQDTLTLSCDPGHSLAPGATYVYSGMSGDKCGTSAFDGPSCTYTDITTQPPQSGIIQFTFNSCTTSPSTSVSPSTINPTPFTCNASIAQMGNGNDAVCENTSSHSYNSYTATSTFVIVKKGPAYQLDWKGIVMHPVKGQTMGDKLAHDLMKMGTYTNSTARYNPTTSTLTIQLTTATQNPCT